jgi:hemolysin activation/secretion protein
MRFARRAAWLAMALAIIVPGACRAQSEEAAPAREAFDILEFTVEGNALLSPLQIERAVYPFLGPGGSIERVEKARAQLEKTYHDAGYLTVLVDVPEQQVREGAVRLKVTEGSVDRLRVRGARYYSQGAIRKRVPALAEGGVPYFPEVQGQLARLNRGADRRVTPVLKPGTAPGTVQLDLNVEDKLPVHGSLELNDRYSANTTHLRLSGMLRYDNLWQRDHSLTLNFQTTPRDTQEVKVFGASYLLPVPNSDNLVALYAVDSQSSVAAVGTLGVIGKGRIFGARAIFPLRPQGGYFHSLSLGVDYKDFEEAVTLLGADSFNTPISYAPLLAQYSGTSQDAGAITQFNLGANFAVRGLLGTREEEFANKRFKAHANYLYLRGDLQRTQTLPRDWSLFGRLDAQLANQPLISNEQFSAGGYDSVRGYLESEQLGDNAWRGSAELRAPSFLAKEDSAAQLNPVGFFEWARVAIRDPLPTQTPRFTLSSAGVGLRLKARLGLAAALDLAWPLRTTTYTRSGHPVLKFRLTYEF